MMTQFKIAFVLLCSLLLMSFPASGQDEPNILLIIADDLGVDAISGFSLSDKKCVNIE